LEAYWSSLKDLLPEAFKGKENCKEHCNKIRKKPTIGIGKNRTKKNIKENGEEKRKYLLLTALGIYAVHRLARDILHSAIKEGIDFRRTEFLKEKLGPIEAFDWEAKTSPLSALGGMKGVSRAYELLSTVLGYKKDNPVAEQSLGSYTVESHQ
jgi:hypothetical protein